MHIDWTHFTPLASLGGGIAGGLLRPARGDIGWRLAFLLGLMAAPLVWLAFQAMPPVQIDHTPALLTISGLLVGIGTRFGNGCTSGHGVCGIARFSPRSLVATLGFMLAGFFTVYAVRHLGG